MGHKIRLPIARRTAQPAWGFEPLLGLQSDINRLFDGRFGSFFEPLQRVVERPEEGAVRARDFVPALSLHESEAAFTVKVELPGVSESDLDLSLSDDVLTIKGEKREDFDREEGGVHYVGRSYGSFMRQIPLPGPVIEDEVVATTKNGLLTIQLPRASEGKERVKKLSVREE